MKYTLILLLLIPMVLVAKEPLSITGPTEAIQPNEDAWLQVTSLTLDEIKTAKSDDTIHVTVYPALDARLSASYDLLRDQPDDTLGLLFGAKYPADYLIEIDIVRGGVLESASFVVIVDGDGPRPDPRPDPKPIPPTIATWVIIVEEKSDRTKLPANQRLVFESAKVRALVSDAKFRLMDRHSTNPNDKLYVERAEKLNQPVEPDDPVIPILFLVDDTGEVVFSGPLPGTVDETVALIGGHTGGAK